MNHKPTGEQQAIITAYLARRRRQQARPGAVVPGLVVNAYAGTGKTTILRLLAEADPRTRFRYLAYNASAKKDAVASFPRHARCTTTHGLAFGPMADLAKRAIDAPKYIPSRKLAVQMKISGPTRLTEDTVLAPGQLAAVVKATIMAFCYSADERITRHHVPNDLNRFDPDEVQALRQIVPPIAQRVWDTDLTKAAGDVHYQHDYYLKAYALTHPRINADVIALDEAQDSNPCVSAMILEQIQYGTIVIMVGDTFQAIYGWRGAKDAMRDFAAQPGVEVLNLTQSFRFGPAIAAEANKWLDILGAPKPLRGFDQIRDRVGPVAGHASAILCRTNAEALKRAIAAIAEGLKVAFPKGVGELIAMVKGAEQIKADEPCEHVDLMAFATWAQVQDYAENEPDGKDLKQFVDLVDEHGTDGLMDILRQIGNEEKGDASDITISTAHMAKGREWRQVLIADDFHEPKRDPSAPASALPRIPREDAMLAYVAVTRAQFVAEVDPGLSWVDNYAGATVTDDTDEPVDDGQPPATVTPASMTVTADPAVLAAIKAKIAEMFPGATVELGTELAVAAG